jgi:hypothetical protein
MTDTVPTVSVPAAQVTIVDVFAKQVEMGAQLAVIHEQLKQLPDHEQRIRQLEAARAKLWGAAAVIGAVCGGGASWVAIIATRR